MMNKSLIYLFLVLIFMNFDISYSQTQDEIESLLGSSNTEELSEKEINKKAKEEKAAKDAAVKTAEKEAKKIAVENEKAAKLKLKDEEKAAKKLMKATETSAKKVKKKEVENFKEEKVKKEKQVTDSISGKYNKTKKQADLLYNQGSFLKASESYQTALTQTKKKKKLAYVNYQAANSHFNLRDYSTAENLYKATLDLDSKKNKYILSSFNLANSLKYQANYIDAKNAYRSFLEKTEKNSKLDFEKSKSRIAVKGCAYAQELIVENPLYSSKNPGDAVNGPYADFGPEIKANELVFSKILSETSTENSNHIAKIYSSTIERDQYAIAQKFSNNINNGIDYVGNPSFTEDGKTVYFSICEMKDNLKSQCAVYSSTLEEGIWTKPDLLPATINEENAYTSQPQIIVDENGTEILYFVAEREKGRGGKDIWYAIKSDDGSFSKAKNLGYPINTKFDEITPFYHTSTQTLYFSSDGQVSLGGFDIYKSIKEEEEFTEPAFMETPVNSSLDDYDFVLNAKGDLGYLVSNRVGTTSLTNATCCDDIFEVRTTNIEVFLKGFVYAENSDSRVIMPTANLVLKNTTKGEEQELKYDGKSYFAQVEKDAVYQLVASSEDFKEVVVDFATLDLIQSDTLQFDVFFKERVSFDNQLIGTIYYEYNQSRLTKEAPKTLAKVIDFLTEYPSTIVKIAAHTDNKGNDKYNLNLSKERAKAAVKYLVFEGISKDRIQEEWFGESQPLEANENSDGSDNEAGRAKNRRTEFVVLGE